MHNCPLTQDAISRAVTLQPHRFLAVATHFGNYKFREATIQTDPKLWKDPHDGLVLTLEFGEMNGDFLRTVDACVAAIKNDPEYAKKFIPNTSVGAKATMGPPRISLRDEAGQRDNFTRIASGAVEVFDDRELPPR